MNGILCNPEVFVALFKSASKAVRLKSLSSLSNTQIRMLREEGILTKKEQDAVKKVCPELCRIGEYKNNEVYLTACDPSHHCINWIMRVKDLTQEQFDVWFEKRIVHAYQISYSLLNWMLKRGLSKNQLKTVLSLRHGSTPKEESVLLTLKKYGYEVSMEEKCDYLFRNYFSISDCNKFSQEEVHEILKGMMSQVLNTARASRELYTIHSVANNFHADKSWCAIMCSLLEGIRTNDWQRNGWSEFLSDPSGPIRAKVKENFTDDINKGLVTLGQLDDIGLGFVFPPSERLLADV